MRQVISWPTSFSISAASRTPLREAGIKARTPTSTSRPPFTTAVTVPTTADFCAKASSSVDQSVGKRLRARQFVVALGVATLHRDWELVPRTYAFGIVVKRAQWQHSLGFVADVQVNELCILGDNGAFQLLRAAFGRMRMGVFKLCEQVAK